jgi:hypothetical protein
MDADTRRSIMEVSLRPAVIGGIVERLALCGLSPRATHRPTA